MTERNPKIFYRAAAAGLLLFTACRGGETETQSKKTKTNLEFVATHCSPGSSILTEFFTLTPCDDNRIVAEPTDAGKANPTASADMAFNSLGQLGCRIKKGESLPNNRILIEVFPGCIASPQRS